MTYHKPGEHHIDVDLSPSLYTKDIKVYKKVWERDFLKTNPRANEGSTKLVDELKEVPVLLVSKKEDCWLVSYEKIMKTMVNSIDGPGTCRKECHKTLKGDILKWKSKEPFEGMSTNPIKVCSFKTLKGDILKWKSKEPFEGMSTNPITVCS